MTKQEEIELLNRMQVNLQSIGDMNYLITQFMVELSELNDSRIKALMDKYQIELMKDRRQYAET